jgi:hypothetical protein
LILLDSICLFCFHFGVKYTKKAPHWGGTAARHDGAHRQPSMGSGSDGPDASDGREPRWLAASAAGRTRGQPRSHQAKLLFIRGFGIIGFPTSFIFCSTRIIHAYSTLRWANEVRWVLLVSTSISITVMELSGIYCALELTQDGTIWTG